ncbi:MAG: helix-turn-helix domain-containing protein [Nanoarchaeota archaeon]
MGIEEKTQGNSLPDLVKRISEEAEPIYRIYRTLNNPKISLTNLYEKAIYLYALKETDYSLEKASKILGVGKTTVWRKMKKYSLKKDF